MKGVRGGDFIKAARLRRGLSQEQVAILTHSVQEEICRWENGQCGIVSDRLLQILDRLHFQLVLQDYEQPSLRATLAIQEISHGTLPSQVLKRLQGMGQEELIQVIGWLWSTRDRGSVERSEP